MGVHSQRRVRLLADLVKDVGEERADCAAVRVVERLALAQIIRRLDLYRRARVAAFDGRGELAHRVQHVCRWLALADEPQNNLKRVGRLENNFASRVRDAADGASDVLYVRTPSIQASRMHAVIVRAVRVDWTIFQANRTRIGH